MKIALHPDGIFASRSRIAHYLKKSEKHLVEENKLLSVYIYHALPGWKVGKTNSFAVCTIVIPRE